MDRPSPQSVPLMEFPITRNDRRHILSYALKRGAISVFEDLDSVCFDATIDRFLVYTIYLILA